MRKIVVLALTLVFTASCGEDATQPDSLRPDHAGAISDHQTGDNDGFWWLAPMVQQPVVMGTFQANASPAIEICEWDGVTCSTVAMFTLGSGMTLEAGHFQVNFDTQAYELALEKTYRIVALSDEFPELGRLVLGFADFAIAENGREAKNLSAGGETIGLVDGRTLPIKFFVNERAYPYAIAEETAADPALDDLCEVNCSVTFVESGETTEASLFEGQDEVTAVLFGATSVPEGEQRVLIIDERPNDDPADEATVCAPGVNGQKLNCFRYELLGGPLAAAVEVGICPRDIVPGQGVWQLIKANGDGVVLPPEQDVSGFLPCAGQLDAGWYDEAPGGVIGFLRPVLDFFVRPAFAEDRRIWGATVIDFSDIYWGTPATASTQDAASVTVPAGATVTRTVQLTSLHSAGPLTGSHVVFSADGGTLSADPQYVVSDDANGLVVASDANGQASVQLQVGAGTVVLTATAVDALAEIVEDGPILLVAGDMVTAADHADLTHYESAPAFEFTVTVALPDLVITSGALSTTPTFVLPGQSTTLSPWTVTNQGQVGLQSGISNAFYLSTDATITADDVLLGNNNNTAGVLGAGQSFNWGGPELTIPATTAPGSYFIGILVDRLDQVVESDETNNFVSTPITVVDPNQVS